VRPDNTDFRTSAHHQQALTHAPNVPLRTTNALARGGSRTSGFFNCAFLSGKAALSDSTGQHDFPDKLAHHQQALTHAPNVPLRTTNALARGADLP